MYCEGNDAGAVIAHNDQFRGVQHGYLDRFKYVNPDYFRLIPWNGPGLKPVGYGYESIEAIVSAAAELESKAKSIEDRRAILKEIDARGIIATPANSAHNELVVEAGRASILLGGRPHAIEYRPVAQIKAKD
jgi:D-galacturonate reductase